MDKQLRVEKGRLYDLGLHRVSGGLSIVSDISGKKNCGIYLYIEKDGQKTDKGKIKEYKIPFLDSYLIGGLYCLYLPDFPYEHFDYLFYADDKKLNDPYARLVDSAKGFGDISYKGRISKCRFYSDDFAWEDDKQPEIPYCDTIIYKLHMRGFTKHASSGVRNRGTFAGLQEKLPYLKELGITAVQVMPVFEFEDKIYNPAYSEIDTNLLSYLEHSESAWSVKTNYWGYTGGNYFAPKRAYAASDRPDLELKELIKALHQNGIELILEFYFSPQTPQGFILDVCRFWVKEYHIDGFKLLGADIPKKLLISDPYLSHTKLIFEVLTMADMPNECDCRHVAVVSAGFLYDIRKYLKGDEDMLRAATAHFRANPVNHAVINEITSYQGFTLTDMVSYDRKHNELNGENNRDGSDYNYSWNCGAEGKTRKKLILTLRERQKKNALLMLLTSQGTPVLLAGDEFGNSADGNNNPYCQDNSISWLTWKTNAMGEELSEFTKALIAFRKAHPVLHKKDALRQIDYLSVGFPDISYHSDQPWSSCFENYNRHIGIMYCCSYAGKHERKDDNLLYIAYNMHWIEHKFALPKLPEGLKWIIKMKTCMNQDIQIKHETDLERGRYMTVPPRTIVILAGVTAVGVE